jgi:transketolase
MRPTEPASIEEVSNSVKRQAALRSIAAEGGQEEMMLEEKAREIRRHALRMIHAARSGHPGGALSSADLLAVLYFDTMRLKPGEPRWNDRDRFILSKGHACPALYAALAMCGFFAEAELAGLRKIDHFLEGHPDIKIPGIDAPSGSLGMGLSQGLGMALGARHLAKDFRVHVILGDGDMQEGNTWEAVMAAGFHRLDNIVAILDANGLQGDAPVEAQMDYFPLLEKLAAFRWNVAEIDGHDIVAVRTALDAARRTKGKPSFILAHTIKGKGVSFMEGQQYWHGSVTMKDDELARALTELARP